ncbi:hypothetical protein NDU88_002693 [Pleurodeles waltl]|uniref:Endonuclease/exonuclease/phosphatase domain-containing protein n=1 Tax=Pleurodeles waltl TaxID=8319 RepID=A0AAV7UZ84_PLEWA|nr:hypothetical protein NDU88_002693 [Pleurodeles waltl]
MDPDSRSAWTDRLEAEEVVEDRGGPRASEERYPRNPDFGGDMNVVVDGETGAGATSERGSLQSFMEAMAVVDLWRPQYPQQRQYTFYSAPHNRFSWLDYIFTHHEGVGRFREATPQAREISSHSPVSILLKAPVKEFVPPPK